jgi:hypothetical protein
MTEYELGIIQGKRQEREAILEYIAYHPKGDLNDIVQEIHYRYDFDERLRLGGIQWDSQFKKST